MSDGHEEASVEVDPLARQVGYMDLLLGLEESGCPVCVAANQAAVKYLDSLLWEFVNDGGVRERLRAAHGFCKEHTFLCVAVADRQAGGLGMAILYQDFLRHAREEAVEAAQAAGHKRRREQRTPDSARVLRPHRSCPACETAHRTAENCLRLLAVAPPESGLGGTARSAGRGLCLPHLAQGLRSAREPEEAESLLEIYLRGEQEIRDQLTEFIRKHDYRHVDEAAGSEAGVWRRAPSWVVGAPVSSRLRR